MTKGKDLKTDGSLLLHFYTKRMGSAVKELEDLYGERYKRYRHRYNLANQMLYEPEFPLYLMLEQTFKCNLSCPSCIHAYKEKKNIKVDIPQMPWEIFEKVVLEGEEYGCPSISMHVNDEPLLIKDLPDRIAFAKEHGFMDIIMTTNGNLFTEEKIMSVVDAGVTRILFSLDAVTEETYHLVRPGGDYKKTIWALEHTIAYRNYRKSNLPIIRASFVVSKKNQHETHNFIKKFSNIVDYVDVQPFSPYYDFNRQLIPDVAIHVDEFHCSQPWKNMIIRADGQILPCCFFYGYEVPVGNVNQETIHSVFNSDYLKKMRKEFKEGIYKHSACLECSKTNYRLPTEQIYNIEHVQNENGVELLP